MRLVNAKPVRDSDALSPASVFAEKYDWLLRWALHFTQNNAALAEDLVQDTFVRLIMSWPRIKDNLHQVEAFLYSTLRYAHLMELRRGRRMVLQDIDLIEFDDLQQSLREEKNLDPIEVQDNLRRVVAYLCWRKRSVKSASILLLRFFHGYFPEEIARIAIMRRRSTNELLRVARQDVKEYLADPNSVQVLHQGKVPEPMPRRVAVPQELFAEELRQTIAQGRSTPCLLREQLVSYYERENLQSIPGELLAHLVSCERCLRIVHSFFNFPTHSDGLMHEARAPKEEPSDPKFSSANRIRRSIDAGMERFRRMYEHHPRSLMIAINGDVIAMRDVNSATSELKVPTPLEKSLGIIDVLSEQGITLLTLYNPAGPPDAPPQMHAEIELSDDRHLNLSVQFNSESAVIELHYIDPLFQISTARDEEDLAEDASVTGAALSPSPAPHRPWRKFFNWFTNLPMPEMSPMLATAMACALAAVILFALSVHWTSVMKPSDLMTRAKAAAAPLHTGQPGVIVQTVRIQTPNRKIERTVYRDVEGRRTLKPKALNPGDLRLAETLAIAGVNWNDPLAPVSFGYWHDHAHIKSDVVKRTGDGLLTLTTTVSDADVASESLTVREGDFHTVSRTIELRDAGAFEVAEVSYAVFPWSSINPELFDGESLSTPTRNGMHAAVLPHPAALGSLPTEAQLDEAELAARVVLNRLQMDDNGGISLRRAADGVHVEAVMSSLAEKQQLQAELRRVPHIISSVSTVAEMDSQPSTESEIRSIRQSTSVDEPSSLDRFLAESGVDRTQASPRVQRFITSSFSAKHESQALADLLDHFAANPQLTDAARTSLSQLVVQHKAALLSALETEQQELVALKLANGDIAPANGPIQSDGAALHAAAENNFALCMELTLGNHDAARAARIIAPRLVASIAQLRMVTLRISAASQLSAAAGATPHESR